MFQHGVSVTVERPGQKDRHGIPSAGTSFELESVALAPSGSTEQIADRSLVTWDVDMLVLDPDVDVRAKDVVLIVDGPYGSGNPAKPTRYSVNGRPDFYQSPFTGSGGTLVRLQGAAG